MKKIKIVVGQNADYKAKVKDANGIVSEITLNHSVNPETIEAEIAENASYGKAIGALCSKVFQSVLSKAMNGTSQLRLSLPVIVQIQTDEGTELFNSLKHVQNAVLKLGTSQGAQKKFVMVMLNALAPVKMPNFKDALQLCEEGYMGRKELLEAQADSRRLYCGKQLQAPKAKNENKSQAAK